ncbi:hypothetical protein PACTADRAFT_15542 [Pachysolen tannophilus NRRL Y-2460]|uniref:Ras-GAP domain-containing protein n=1 Tax=Pachysolen tannophilus NRRL Y-2460 TaxID=669874 RepID=A0A1E4TZ60_PACTA|nr:hypothetical protein PACTADRAFT_15542 [Pachysolen tannophilus NRRL Y-2460]
MGLIWDKSNIPAGSLVESIYSRIGPQLPLKSGLTVSELEIDVFFVRSRNTLLKIAETDKFSDMIRCTCSILEEINAYDKYVPLVDRKKLSLRSILVMLRLLSDLLEVNWNTMEETSVKYIKKDYNSNELSSVAGIGSSASRVYYHTVRPKKLDDDTMNKALAIIANLKSGRAVLEKINEMKGNENFEPNHIHQSLIDSIDLNCESILRYLAASNPGNFLFFLKSQLIEKQSTPITNININANYYQYADLLSLIYFDENLIISYLKKLASEIEAIKLETHQQLVLLFLTESIRFWILSNPQQYVKAVNSTNSELSNVSDKIFESLFKKFDLNFQYFESLSVFLIFTLLISPTSLDHFMNANKLKVFAPRTNQQLFLKEIIKQVTIKGPKLTAATRCIVNVMIIAGSTKKYNPDSQLVKFSFHYSELLYDTLSMDNPCTYIAGAVTTLVDSLRVDYFVAATILLGDQFINKVIKQVKDPEISLPIMKIISGGLRALSTNPDAKKYFIIYLDQCSNELREFILKAAELVIKDSNSQRIAASASIPSSSPPLVSAYSSPVSPLVTEKPSTLKDDSSAFSSTSKDSSSGSSISGGNVFPHHHRLPPKPHKKDSISNFRLLKNKRESKKQTLYRSSSLSAQQLVTQSIAHSSGSTSTLSPIEICDTLVLYKTILVNLLAVYRAKPLAYLFPEGATEEFFNDLIKNPVFCKNCFTKVEELISPIVYLVAEDDSNIVDAASLFSLGFLEKLRSAKSFGAKMFFVGACSYNILAVSNLLGESLETQLPVNKVKEVLDFLVTLMEGKYNGMNSELSPISSLEDIHQASICQEINESLERAFLATFLLPDLDIFRLTRRALKYFILEADANFHEDRCYADVNMTLYKSINDDASVITGLVALQRKMKKLYIDKVRPTSGVIETWLKLFSKWQSVVEQDKDDSFYANNLASASGIFLTNSFKDKKLREEFLEKIDTFITQKMQLLESANLRIRETAREVLSSEMHPLCFKFVVAAMVKQTAEIKKKDVTALTETDLSLIEQYISIVRYYFTADPQYVYSLVSDLYLSTLIFVQILDSIPDSFHVLKIKLKLGKVCQFIDSCKAKMSTWGLIKYRNIFARRFLEWTEKGLMHESGEKNKVTKVLLIAKKTSSTLIPSDTKEKREMDLLYFDVGVESLKVMVGLLESLPLEAPQATHEKELIRSKKVVFGNYFSLLYRILEKYNGINSAEMGLSLKHKINIVVDSAVLGLANLIQSNVDVGLEFALPLSYNQSRKIRLSLLKVFANIVDRVNVYDNPDIENARIFHECSQLIAKNLPLAVSIAESCPNSDIDTLALSLLSISDNKIQILDTVCALLKREISNVKNEKNLLRYNTVATRMLALYCKRGGLDYLQRVLKPTLLKIAESKQNIDIDKLSIDDPSSQEKLDVFMESLHELVNSIVGSIEYLPNDFKYISSVIYETTGSILPDSKTYSVSAFMFLRFIVPAIVTPESSEIINFIPDAQFKKSCLQLARVIQILANSSITSIKSPLLLSRMNELTILHVQITNFLKEVAKFTPKTDFIDPVNVTENFDFRFLHRFFYNYAQKIRECYLSYPDISIEEKIEVFSKFDNYLCALGQPHMLYGHQIPESIKENSKEGENSLYEFMSKFSMREFDSSEESLVHETISSDGTPTIVLNYCSLKSASAEDSELLMYYIFHVASKIWDSKFYIVIDCTGFNGTVEFFKAIDKLAQLYVTDIMRKNLDRIYYYNVSQKYFGILLQNLKMLEVSSFLDHSKDIFHFASCFDSNKIGFGLSASSTAVGDDSRVVFNDVSLYEPLQKRFVPVTIKIGDEFLQIGFRQPTKFKVCNVMKSLTITDIYRISDLSGAEASSITGVPDEICITNSIDGSQLILASPKKIEIMRTIYFSKTRNTSLSHKEEYNITRIEFWIGELINIDFVGLLSDDEEIRKVAYTLLCSLSKSFRIDLGRRMQSSSSVNFPQDNASYVIKTAKTLAENHKNYSYDIVNGFFAAYKNSASYQRPSTIMYVSAFIQDVFKNINLLDEEFQDEKASALLRKFIEVSIMHKENLVIFQRYVWSKLALQDGIAFILIKEVVGAAIDREAEGKPWDDIISLLTLTPTVEVCGKVVTRLRELSHIPKPENESSIFTHTSWIEITVLVNACVTLFFDSLFFSEMFMADILYISTIYMDMGPKELRVSLHKLVVNVMNSFLSKDDLSEENKNQIISIISNFYDDRTKLLLGLNRDGYTTNLIENDANIIQKISALETYCESLIKFISVSGDIADRNKWRARWNSYAVDAAFRDNSMLQDRAFLLLGTLASYGVTDMLVGKVLITTVGFCQQIPDIKSFNLIICALYTLGRVVEGLSPSSPYTERFYWLSLTLNYADSELFAQTSIQLLAKSLEAIDKRGKFVNGDLIEGLFKKREIFSSVIEDYEKSFDLAVTPENLDLIVISIFIRGLQERHTKHSAFTALLISFKVRAKNAILKSKITNGPIDDRCFSYLVIIFILVKSDNELLDYMKQASIENLELIKLDDHISIPKVLVDFLLSNSDFPVLTLMKGTIYQSSAAASELSNYRFLLMYKYISERSERLRWLLYPEIKNLLRKVCTNTSTQLLLNCAYDISSDAIKSSKYQRLEEFAEELNELVKNYNLVGAKDMRFAECNLFILNDRINGAVIPTLIKMINTILSSVLDDD